MAKETFKLYPGMNGWLLIFPISFLLLWMVIPKKVVAADSRSKTEVFHSDKLATKLAVNEAGFSSTVPPTYRYKDSSSNSSAPSFDLVSESANQRVTCMIRDGMNPIDSIAQFSSKSPRGGPIAQAVVDKGEQVFHGRKLKWILCRLTRSEQGKSRDEDVLIASFPAVKKGKSVLVVGRALANNLCKYNYKTTLFILDEIFQPID